MNKDSAENILQIDPSFILIMVLIAAALINISLFLHIRKVDGSIAESDLKGYTWKSNILGVVLGIVFTIVILVFTIFYILE